MASSISHLYQPRMAI